jgi:hypothetical protein
VRVFTRLVPVTLTAVLVASLGAAATNGGRGWRIRQDAPGLGAAVQQERAYRTLSDLTWLAGYWVGEDGGVKMEELWLPPRGSLMLGLHRDVSESGKAFYEYLRIEETAEGIVYFASPRGKPATAFQLASGSRQRAVFENPRHDFPTRIIYWLDRAGSLHARIEGEQEGRKRAEEWVWGRSALE